jgi:hypothetical protein
MQQEELEAYVKNPRSLPMNGRIALAQLLRACRDEDGLPAAMWAADRVEGGVDRTVHLSHKQEPTRSLEDTIAAAKKLIEQAGEAKADDF